jgi:hypothetical protein
MEILAMIILYLIFSLLLRWSQSRDFGSSARDIGPSAESSITSRVVSKIELAPFPRATIIYFRSNDQLNAVIEGQEIGFEWEVVGASSVYFVQEGKATEVSAKSQLVSRCSRSQSVHLLAENPEGRKSIFALSIKVFPLPKFEHPIPFPEITLGFFVDVAAPSIIRVNPPSLGLLKNSIEQSVLLNATNYQKTISTIDSH